MVAHQQPAAQQTDGDVGQTVGQGDDGSDDGGGEIGFCLRLLSADIDGAVLFLHVGLQIVGLGGGKVGEGFLHHGVEVAALGEHIVKMLLTLGGDEGRQEDGRRRQGQHQQSQQPVFPQHHHTDDDDHQKAGHQGVNDLMDVVAHGGHVVGHPRKDVANGRLIHEADGQALDLFGDTDAQITGEVAADHVVEQEHFQIAEQAVADVDCQQYAQLRQDIRQQVAGVAALPVAVEIVDQRAQELRPDHGAEDHAQAEQTGQQEPLPDGLCLQQKPGDHTFFFSFHFVPPPV